MLHYFYDTICFAFFVKLFWHLLNNQLLQTNWLLGLRCASCFGTKGCVPKAVHRAQPFGMRAGTLQLQVADKRCHQQGGNQLPDCHPIFAQMASEQAGHPSNLKTRLLTLTGHLCRPKWHIAMQLVWEIGHFTHQKRIPACESFICSWR